MILVLVATISMVLGQLPTNPPPSDCCSCGGPVSQACPAMAYTCPLGASPAGPDICYAPALYCPKDKHEQQWAVQDKDMCKCGQETNNTGWECKLVKPQGCEAPFHWDGSMLNTDPDGGEKVIECRLTYSDFLGGLLPIRDHRIEAVMDMSYPAGQGKGKFVIWTRFEEDEYCSQVQAALTCDLANCTGETLVEYNNEILYLCDEVKCIGCSGDFSPGGSNCDLMRMLAKEATGHQIEISFPGDTLDRALGTAVGVIVPAADGDAQIALDVSCRTGGCYGKPGVETTGAPPESPWNESMKTSLAVVSACTFVALSSLVTLCLCQRRITRHKRQQAVGGVMMEKDEAPPLETQSTALVMAQGELSPVDFVTHSKDGDTELAVDLSADKKKWEVAVRASKLTYDIAGRQILKGISLIVRPRELVLIMGPSGAGKTCLLNILSGRTNRLPGIIQGEAQVMGSKATPAHRRAYSSYVPQTETLIHTDTVSEAVYFAAKMRRPKLSNAQIRAHVDAALAALKIQHIADSIIGTTGRGGISGGEKRRVAIAVELVCQPQLLFLDEPTSSLDSTSVRRVLQQLRGLTRPANGSGGCAVVATIHQLPHYFYKKFDKLVLLDCIGRLTFFGTPTEALEMVKAAGIPFPEQANAADVLLDICSDTSLSDQMIHVFEKSDAASYLKMALEGPMATPTVQIETEDNEDPIQTRRHMAPFTRFGLLFQRNVKYMAREPSLLLTTVLFTVISALFTGGVFFQLDNKIPGTANRAGSLFFMLTYFILTSLSALGVFITQREVFKKEHADGYYSIFSYFMSQVLGDLICLRLFPPLVFGLVTYFMIGFQLAWDKFLIFLGLLVLSHLTATSWCLFISVVSRNQSQASLIAVIFFIYCIMFQGLLVNTSNSDNNFLRVRYASFAMYAYEALMINEFEGLKLVFNPVGYPEIGITGETILTNYGISVDNLAFDSGMLFMFFCAFLLLAGVSFVWRATL
eukprot:gb/GEZN01001019.1/.p1 GENE.gb/GEZN01001019.1/~~gb/GEZN01001019.1/.p1  ORF type:complete len:980 (-),score=112.86 gb/GEZN01001019.1/:442-3381(-)